MQIQCPKCNQWFEDDSGACPFCGASLSQMDSNHPPEENSDVQDYMKQTKEARKLHRWTGLLIGGIILAIFSLTGIQALVPAAIGAFIIWISIYALIDLSGDIKIQDAIGVIPPQVRRFEKIWFTANVLVCVLTILLYSPRLYDPIRYRMHDLRSGIIDMWLSTDLVPLFVVIPTLFLGMICYPAIKQFIANRAAKKMIKG